MKLELLQGSRSRILALMIFIVMGIFVIRLFYLQVIQHEYYKGLAEAEQQIQAKIPASRGLIYAKSGDKPVQLVLNEKVYTVFADPQVVDDKEKVVEVMRKIAGGNVRTNFDELLDNKESRYQIIATKVTRVQAEKIKAEQLHGIGFQEVTQRVYPEGKLAAQVLGFVNAEGKGNYGVEAGLDSELRGTDGLLKTVKDVSNVPLTIGADNVRIPSKDGKNVVLSIDRNIQSSAEQILANGLKRTGAKNGSMLVMDPQTGKVLAMANLPTFNPAEYFLVKDPAVYNNPTITAPYEPGSDVKTFTMAVGIDKGVVKPNDTFNNTDSIRVEDRTISNAYKGVTGNITFQTAMNWSLNTGFVTIAQRLGNGREITREARDTMYHYFHDRLGLGELTGVELSGESKGIVIPPTEVEGNAVRYSNMAFGQGLDATMVQVSAAFSAIINGGNYYKPTVIDGYMDPIEGYKQNPTPEPLRRDVVKSSTSRDIREMTHIARTSGFPGVDKAGYYVGGKTGTSQVIVNGQYSGSETIATYLGFGASKEHPEYVIMVQLSGKNQILGGAQHALPIFTDMSNWLIEYLKIKPKG